MTSALTIRDVPNVEGSSTKRASPARLYAQGGLMEQPNYWERLARKRLSRRKLLAAGGVAALGGGAALVVGCGGSNNNNGSSGGASGSSRPSGAAGGSPRPGGEVVFGRLLNVGGIDPHIDLTGLDIDTQLYSYLYNWDPINEVLLTNNFATAFEQPD